MASLSSPHFSHSPQLTHTLTHTSSTSHLQNKPKKRKSLFRKLTHKISPKDNSFRNFESARQLSCPNLLDEPDLASPMSPVMPYYSSKSCSTLRGARSPVPSSFPLFSLGEDDVFATDPPGPPTIHPQHLNKLRPHSVSVQSAVPLSRECRRNSSWEYGDSYSRKRTSVEVSNIRRRTLLDVPEVSVLACYS